MSRWKLALWVLALTAVVIYLYGEAGRETEIVKATLQGYPTMARPAFWPRVMLVGLLVTGLTKLFLLARNQGSQAAGPGLLKLLLIPKVMVSVVIVGLYCYLSQYLGFAFATIVFTATYMLFLGIRRPRQLILFPILSTFGFLLVFWRILYVAVPKGEGVFLAFSNFMMAIVRFGT